MCYLPVLNTAGVRPTVGRHIWLAEQILARLKVVFLPLDRVLARLKGGSGQARRVCGEEPLVM